MTVSYTFAVDGVLDPTFNGTGTVLLNIGATEAINDLAIQANGRIVGGGFVNTDWALVRLNQNGTLDTTFNSTGIVITNLGTVADQIRGIAIQTDQKIVAVGSSGIDAAAVFATGRYNTNGSLDTTFGSGGIVTTALTGSGDIATELAIQVDGKIVVVGRANLSVGIVRYNTNGTLDTTFGTGGIVTTSVGTFAVAIDVVLQPDGKIVIGGTATIAGTSQFLVARYNTNGSLDTTFGTGGIVTTSLITPAVTVGIVLQADNKIVIGGSNDAGFVLARYNTNGSLDTTFGTSGIVSTTVNTINIAGGITIQPDQKLVFTGATAATLGAAAYTVIRYNTNGSLDTTFGIANNGIVTTNIDDPDIPRAITLQSNGKIVVAGGSGGGSANNDISFARYIGNGPTYAVEWGNLDVGLNSNMELRDTAITFTGSCSLDGRNHQLILKDNSQIMVGVDSRLLLENITIVVEQDGAIQGSNNNSTLLLDNVTLILEDDLSFPFGKFSIIRDCEVLGQGREFTYQSAAMSTIEAHGKLILGKDLTFTYDPQSAQRNLVRLVDESSQLILNGTTLHSTITGYQVTRGELLVNEKSFIASDATTESNGIMFGDGINLNENLKVTISPAAQLEVISGFLVFADV